MADVDRGGRSRIKESAELRTAEVGGYVCPAGAEKNVAKTKQTIDRSKNGLAERVS